MPIKDFNKHVKQYKTKNEEIGKEEEDSRNCPGLTLEKEDTSSSVSKHAEFKSINSNSPNSTKNENMRDEYTNMEEIA